MNFKLLIAIVLLAGTLRFYHLTYNPPAMYVDEVALGYNAYSILKTGRDEFGEFLPTSLRSFGDYKPAAYAYLLVPVIALLGLNEFAVRLPSALLGTFTIPLVYLSINKILNNKKIALLSALFLALDPWHLQFSRAGFEATVMVFFLLTGFTLFIFSNFRFKFLLAAAMSFGLAFNSYHAARIWLPIFFLILGLYYRKEIVKNLPKITLAVTVFLFLALPIFLNLGETSTRAREVSIAGRQDPGKLFISNYLSHFSPTFLFLSGDKIGRHSAGGMGELYVFQLPFILIGLIYFLRKKDRETRILLAWLLISPLGASIAAPAPHALRSLVSVPLWSILTAVGVEQLSKINFNKHLKFAGVAIISAIAFYNVLTYLHLYHVHYPIEKARDWGIGVKEMVNFVAQNMEDKDKVYVTAERDIPYIYFLFYTKYNPKRYQQEHGSSEHFAKYYFYKGVWNFPDEGKYLIVTDPGGHPENLIKEIYIRDTELIYRIGKK